MIAGVSPRFDVGHLIFAVPLFYVLAASFLPLARWTLVPAGAVALLFLFSAAAQRFATETIVTPFGAVRTDPESVQTVRWLMNEIQPGERIFVYPFFPIAYAVTGGKNVSRYCFMQPGVYTEADERLAIGDLVRNPPAKVLYLDISRAELLRIWPASDPSRLSLPHLHGFVTANFQPAAHFRNLQVYTPKR
jgi:hypothetical protein